ncbi:MAG: tRNA (guanosine(46)-N7)-methyltransferase TrmB [Burkholderiales bacterium]|nr:tRNA (guanosine(46)-N7)-methyltransferase TrmB [Burkholderiales bacterium]
MSLKPRHIKSFVLRQGKITSGQQQALTQLMPQYGIGYTEHLINLEQYFQRTNSKIIEIGFGMGHASWQIAKQNPDNDYLGIEVHAPGVGALLMSLLEHEITNMRIIQHDAVLVLKNMIMDNSITGFHIYFPDPWHKKKHHKRRLIQTDFIDLMCSKLKDDGYIHVATDWEHYAMYMLKLFGQNKQLSNQSINGDFVERPQYRPLTKFEQRGVNLGHQVWDLVFKKNKFV